MLSIVGVQRVGEGVSVHEQGFGNDTICFRRVKNSRRLFTRDFGINAAVWSKVCNRLFR